MATDYARFFELSLDLLATIAPDGRFQDLSPAWEEVVGYTREELRGAIALDFIHQGDIPRVLEIMERAGEGVRLIRYEVRFRCKDGGHKWLAWTVNHQEGDSVGYCIARDVTAHREALAERDRMLEEMHRFRALIEATSDFVGITDGEGVTVYINPAGLRTIGREDEAGQVSLAACYPPEVGAQVVSEHIPAAMRDGIWQGDTELMHRDGTRLPMSGIIVPLRDPAGAVRAFGSIMRDISSTKRLQAELVQRQQQQQEVLSAMATPIIRLWDDVVTLPIVGVVDSVRASEMKEALLHSVARTGARIAIVDMTGVDTVDTATADHIMRLMQGVQLLGAQGIITGIQPAVAQIMVSLGVDMGNVMTLRSLQEGLRYSLRKMGYRVIATEA
jgi:rsbT co-antagonist protein RsbR